MFSLLFRNRWLALGWATLMLVSVSVFVGKDGGAERNAEAARHVEAQRELLKTPPPAAPIQVIKPTSKSVIPPPVQLPPLERIPGSTADPANPQVGDVFIDPATGQRLRVIRRDNYSSSAPSP